MTSDGLRAPLNAPPAADLGYGVAPATSTPLVVANRVVVFGSGSGSAATGVFVYDPSPGFGNLIASTTDALFDPFGNAIPAKGVTTYHVTAVGVWFAVAHQGADIIAYQATSPAGPWNLLADLNFSVVHGSGVGQFTFNSAPIVSQAGTVTAPTVITTDAWNQLSVGGSWTNAGTGVNGFFYRLQEDGNVLLAWEVNNNSATPGTLGTLPAAYQPATTVHLVSGWSGTGPVAYNDQFAPALQITSGGVITGLGMFVGTLTMFGTAIMPLGSL